MIMTDKADGSLFEYGTYRDDMRRLMKVTDDELFDIYEKWLNKIDDERSALALPAAKGDKDAADRMMFLRDRKEKLEKLWDSIKDDNHDHYFIQKDANWSSSLDIEPLVEIHVTKHIYHFLITANLTLESREEIREYDALTDLNTGKNASSCEISEHMYRHIRCSSCGRPYNVSYWEDKASVDNPIHQCRFCRKRNSSGE